MCLTTRPSRRTGTAAHQPLGYAPAYDSLEDVPQHIAVPEAAVPVLREGRVVRHVAFQTEPAEPSVGEVQMDLLAKPPLRPDAEAVADDQHPDQQLGVDRRPACRTVERSHMRPHAAKIDKAVDRA